MKKIFITTVTAMLLLGAGELFAESRVYFDWFWLFYEREKNTNELYIINRPFYLSHATERGFFETVLMPILYWRYETPKRDDCRWFFGFGNSVNVFHENGDWDYDLVSFPIFYGRGPRDDDRYLLVWPIGGTLREKIGMDRISAWVFPGFLLFIFFPPPAITSYLTLIYIVLSIIPVWATFDYKDFHGWGILWPFIHHGSSPTRRETRVLPFFSVFHKDGWYDRYSVLILFSYTVDYYSDDVHKMFFFFPVFGRRWSETGRISATTVLWPFFSWGYNRRTGDRSYNLPWPLVQVQDCVTPRIKKRIFFPFYGDYIYENNETFFVTPLYFRMKKTSVRFDSVDYIICFIVWYYRRDYHSRTDPYYGNRWRYFKIWPLFHVEYNDLGDYTFNLLSLLPWRDPEGYERLYGPIWSIVEYRRFQSGERRLGILLRLYYQRWGDGFMQVRVPFVFTYESRENRLTEFTVLLSMFGYTHTGSGRYMRLFWIPIRLGDPDDAIAERGRGRMMDEDDIVYDYIGPQSPSTMLGHNRVHMLYNFF